MFMYTVRDSKSEAYLPPFLAENAAVAIRLLVDAAEGPNSIMGKHPEDFQVFQIGEFDQQSGEVKGIIHTSIGKIIDFMGQNETRELSQS